MKACSDKSWLGEFRWALAPPEDMRRQVLKAGSGGNALVSLVSTETGDWILKDFGPKNFLVRNTLGRFLVLREVTTLGRLQGLEGVPAEPVRFSPFCFGYRYAAGETLSALREQGATFDRDYFLSLERLVANLHSRGFVHLDLRNGKNILRAPDGRPHLLDFQSGLWVGRFPKWLRGMFEKVDYSGVYKWWGRLAPQHLDEERRAVLQRINRQRRFWPFNN